MLIVNRGSVRREQNQVCAGCLPWAGHRPSGADGDTEAGEGRFWRGRAGTPLPVTLTLATLTLYYVTEATIGDILKIPSSLNSCVLKVEKRVLNVSLRRERPGKAPVNVSKQPHPRQYPLK